MKVKVFPLLFLLLLHVNFLRAQEDTTKITTDTLPVVTADTLLAVVADASIWDQEKPLLFLEQSDRVANYVIEARLNPSEKIIDGDMSLTWKNYSNDTIRELQFHMYLNAFKNSKSTFFREAKDNGAARSFGETYPDSWGYIDIVSLKIKNGAVLTDSQKFIQPDDNNKDDQTVASYALKDPIKPGETVTIKVSFKSKLPEVVARTGFHGKDFYMVAQWFPKLGVYEPAGWRYAEQGQWNCHQFHANSEFYANFGTYDVTIDAPSDFIIGATGMRAQEPIKKGNFTKHRYIANDVVDFAWTASPRYIVKEDQWENVKLRLLIQKEHLKQADRYLESAKATLAYFKKHLGEYPYSTLTLVDPPSRASAAGGMEYPTLVTLGTMAHSPMGMRALETVTVHEIGHQYFMGILASNEFEEPWLDEGFNSYWEDRVMDATYGAKTSTFELLGLHAGSEELSRMSYVGMHNPKIAENYRCSWKYTEGGYGTLTYKKASTWLHTLHNMVGDEAMDEIWKTYYKRWRFRHPNAKSFIAIVNEVVKKHHGTHFGESMDWYFEQFLYGTNTCDYAVERITNGKPLPRAGYFGESSSRQEIKYVPGQQKFDNYISKVVVHRHGEVVLPVELLVHFEDGTEKTINWDGKARTKSFFFKDKTSKILWAKIDPEHKITMDVNYLNNSVHLKPSRKVALKYSLKLTFWLQNILEFFALFA